MDLQEDQCSKGWQERQRRGTCGWRLACLLFTRTVSVHVQRNQEEDRHQPGCKQMCKDRERVLIVQACGSRRKDSSSEACCEAGTWKIENQGIIVRPGHLSGEDSCWNALIQTHSPHLRVTAVKSVHNRGTSPRSRRASSTLETSSKELRSG